MAGEDPILQEFVNEYQGTPAPAAATGSRAPQAAPTGAPAAAPMSFFQKAVSPQHDDYILAYGFKTGAANLVGGTDRFFRGLQNILFPATGEMMAPFMVHQPSEAGVLETAGAAVAATVAQKYDAAKDIVLGVMGMVGGFPLAAPVASIGEMLQRKFPDLAASEILPAWAHQHTAYVRAMMGQDPGSVAAAGSPEAKAMGQPITMRDAVEFALTFALPILAGKVTGKGKATEPVKAVPTSSVETAISGAQAASAKGEAAVSKIEGLAQKAGELPQGPPMQVLPEREVMKIAERAATMPFPPPEGPRIFGVNWQRLGQSESTKRAILAVNEQLAEAGRTVLGEGARPVEAGGPGAKPHAATKQTAATIGLSIEDVLKVPEFPEAIRSLEDLAAFEAGAKAVHEASARAVDNMFQMARAGDLVAKADLPTALGLFSELTLKYKDIGTYGAQFLEARKISPDVPSIFSMSQFQENVNKLRGVISTDRMIEQYQAMTKPKKQGWMRDVWGAIRDPLVIGGRLVNEIWIHDLLLPASVGKKIATDIVLAVNDLATTSAGRLFKFSVGEGQEPIAAGELKAQLYGRYQGARQALAAISAGKNVDIGTAFDLGRKPREYVLSAKGLGLEGVTGIGPLADYVGELNRVWGTAIGVTTDIARTSAMSGELYARALRRATWEGRTGAELGTRVEYIASHVGDQEFSDIRMGAEEAGLRGTLTEPVGRAGQGLLSFIHRGYLKWDVPFFNILWNGSKRVAEWTPLLNVPSILKGHLNEMLREGGAQRQRALAQISLGLVAGGLVYTWAASGKLRGEGATDPSLRDWNKQIGKAPYTFDLPWDGGGTMQYDHILPLGGMMAVTATMAEIIAQHSNEDDDLVTRAGMDFLGLGMAWAHVMGSQPFASGLAHVAEVIDPRGPADLDTRLRSMATSFARSLVPGTIRAGDRIFVDNVVREARTIPDAWRSVTPGFSEMVKPHRDRISGEPFLYPVGNSWSPVFYFAPPSSPYQRVYQMLADNRIQLPDIPRMAPTTGIQEPFLIPANEPQKQGTPLTDGQRDRWQVLKTQEVRLGGKLLGEALDAQLDEPSFQAASMYPGGGKELKVRDLYAAYTKAAWERLQQEDPDLRKAVQDRTIERLKLRLLPTTDVRSPQFGQLGQSLGR